MKWWVCELLFKINLKTTRRMDKVSSCPCLTAQLSFHTTFGHLNTVLYNLWGRTKRTKEKENGKNIHMKRADVGRGKLWAISLWRGYHQALQSSLTQSCEIVFLIRRAVRRAAPLAYQHSRIILPMTRSAFKREKTIKNQLVTQTKHQRCKITNPVINFKLDEKPQIWNNVRRLRSDFKTSLKTPNYCLIETNLIEESSHWCVRMWQNSCFRIL